MAYMKFLAQFCLSLPGLSLVACASLTIEPIVYDYSGPALPAAALVELNDASGGGRCVYVQGALNASTCADIEERRSFNAAMQASLVANGVARDVQFVSRPENSAATPTLAFAIHDFVAADGTMLAEVELQRWRPGEAESCRVNAIFLYEWGPGDAWPALASLLQFAGHALLTAPDCPPMQALLVDDVRPAFHPNLDSAVAAAPRTITYWTCAAWVQTQYGPQCQASRRAQASMDWQRFLRTR